MAILHNSPNEQAEFKFSHRGRTATRLVPEFRRWPAAARGGLGVEAGGAAARARTWWSTIRARARPIWPALGGLDGGARRHWQCGGAAPSAENWKTRLFPMPKSWWRRLKPRRTRFKNSPSGGGGGYGNPLARAGRAGFARTCGKGYVTVKSAAELYMAWCSTPKTFEVDVPGNAEVGVRASGRASECSGCTVGVDGRR